MKRLILILLLIALPLSISYGLPTQQPTGLAWDAPTLNTDGSPLTDLAGYYVYWSAVSGGYSDTDRQQVAVATIRFTDLTALADATDKYFVVTAYNTLGYESPFSNEVQNRPLVIPSPAGNLRIN